MNLMFDRTATVVRKLAGPGLAIAAFLLVASTGFADAKGEAVAKQYFDLKKSADSSATATMTLIDKTGSRKVRKLEMYSKEGPEGRNSFTNFLEPADVAGTKFLTLTHRGSDSEQRLYLPALKKARKIASGTKDGDFLNSDFSYYDLETREYAESTYTWLADNETIADKAFEGMKFAKIEMKSKDQTTPYAKSIAWINTDNHAVYKLELYDRKDNGLIKTMLFAKIETIQGVLVPTQMVMTNNRKGTKTLLAMEGLKINTGLKDDIFSLKNLEK